MEGGRCDVAFATGLLRPGWARCDAVLAAGLAQPAIVRAGKFNQRNMSAILIGGPGLTDEEHLARLRRGRRRCRRPPAAWRGFGPFRRKNGRRQCPRPGPTVTKLGRTAVVLPTPWPTKFRGRQVWGGYSSGRHHGSIGGRGQ